MKQKNNTNSTKINTYNNVYINLALLTLCFVALYYHVIIKMIVDWSNNDNYSHGFLIPFISALLIWRSRDKLSRIDILPSKSGLLILFVGLCFFFLADIGAELFTMRVSMIVVLLSLVIYMGGWQLAKHLSPPIAYLIFMIPLPGIIWNKIAFPLKLFATKISASLIQAVGIAVYREGNIIHLSNSTLQVVDACSGLRSMTSILALSAAFALISNHSITKKWILFLSAVPIAVLVNVIRLTAAAILSENLSERFAKGFLHEASGILVFLLAIIFLYTVHLLLQKFSRNEILTT